MPVITDLVSYWACDEASGNLLDAHGSNTLTETSGLIETAPGKVAGCRDFEAADTEYFEIPSNASLSPGDTTFSFAAWVQLESLADRAVLGKYTTALDRREYMVLFQTTANRFEFRVTSTGFSSPSGSALATTFGAPSLGVWYFVVAGHDHVANQLFISVNAGVQDVTAYSAGIFQGPGPFQIGSLGVSGGLLFWDGLLDEIGYWAKRLTADEIAFLYNSGAGRSYADIVAESNPVPEIPWWNQLGQSYPDLVSLGESL